MSRPDFDRMWNEMLRSGVAAGVAARTIAELQDHFDDIEAEAMAAGDRPDAASDFAMRRLGRPDILVAAVTSRQELRSGERLGRTVVHVFVLAPGSPSVTPDEAVHEAETRLCLRVLRIVQQQPTARLHHTQCRLASGEQLGSALRADAGLQGFGRRRQRENGQEHHTPTRGAGNVDDAS